MGNTSGPGRSWRQNRDKAQPESAGKRSWQHGKQASDEAESPRSRRLLVRFFAFLLLIGVVGLITWVVLLFSGTKPLTLIHFAHSDPTALNSPSNIYSQQCVQELDEWAKEKPSARKAIHPDDADWQRKDQTAKDWIDWLIKEGKKSGEIVVYYFDMPGHADLNNGPYLWVIPADATHPEAKHRLYLRDLLDRINTDLSATQKKVLIFDSTQVGYSKIHGMVTNDFARGLKTLESKINEVPECYIFSASGENQLSWTSPELGRSIFGHFLTQGLRGAARRTDNRPKISIKDLTTYVSTNTEKWSQANRGAVQIPMFLPAARSDKADGVEMATIPREVPLEPEAKQRDELLTVKPDWEKYYQLAQLTPAPEVVAPHQWKRYTALLIRLEKLLFAGAQPGEIQNVRRSLETLNTFIVEQSRSPAWSNSLLTQDLNTVDAKTREKEPTLAKASTVLNVLWKTDDQAALKEDVQKWKDIVATTKDNPTLRRQLLLHSWRWTMEKTLNEPDVVAAERVFSLIEEELRPGIRPADVHFIRMLVRDTQEKPWSLVRSKIDLLKKAIALRMKAECVAWRGSDANYSTAAAHWIQIQRWIIPTIKQADEVRRKGEDLLFDANAAQWEKAQTFFTQADQLYTEAGAKAQILIQASQLRDQVYYQLPYYADWAAQGPGPLVEQVLTSWDHLHRLAKLMLSDQSLDEKLVLAEANQLRKVMVDLQVALLKQIRQEVRAQSTAQASSFHELERLLNIPFILDCYEGASNLERAQSAQVDRIALLRRLKDASFRLFTLSQQAGKIAESPSQYRPDDYADARLRLDHASLGNDAAMLIRSSNVTPLVLNWSVDRRVGPQDQQSNLMQVSEKVGSYWSVLPLVLQQNDEAKATLELLQSTGTISTLGRAERWMAQAAELDRQIDAGTKEPTNKFNLLTATQMERWYLTHRLLLWQAERSLDEGWADYQAQEVDYSKKVAVLHVDAAQELLGTLSKEKSVDAKDKGWHAFVVDARSRISLPGGQMSLTINNAAVPKQLQVTDEPHVKFSVGLKTSGVPVAGYPVIRLWSASPADGNQATLFTLQDKMVKDYPGYYSRAILAADAPPEEPLMWENILARMEVSMQNSQSVPLQARLLHRGHLYEKADIQVVMQTTPRIRWVREAPDDKQGLVVFGSERRHDGHIHILFDTTLSMTEPVIGQTMSKIDAARRALEAVLDQLPPDVTLSISSFRGHGQKMKDLPCTELIFGPTKWDESTKQKYIKTILDALPTHASLNAETGTGGTSTPIIRGIRETLFQNQLKPLFPIEENGPFTLLLLTDGVENEDTNNFAENLRNKLLNCKYRQLICHIMLFSVDQANITDDEEKKRLREMLQIETEPYKQTFYSEKRTPPRLWPNIKSINDLIDSLNDALRPRFTVLQNNEPIKDASDVRVTLPNEANWHRVFLKAANYDVFTAGLLQKIKLEKGDRLGIKIDRKSLNTQLIMPSIAELDPAIPDALKRKQGGIVLAMLGQQMMNVSGGGHALQIQAMMEQPIEKSGRETTLTRQRPKFAWFHLNPLLNDTSASNSNIHLTVTEQVHELASVWTLQSNPWPARTVGGNPLASPAGYRLEANWVSNSVEPVCTIALPNLSAGTGVINPTGSVSVPGGRLEDLMIRQRGVKASDWLYVRCTHTPDKPVLIQLRRTSSLPGFTPRTIAEEHRFFYQANSVSAWFDLASLTQEKELSLDIYSLNDLVQQPAPNVIKLDYESNDAGNQSNRLKSRSWNRD